MRLLTVSTLQLKEFIGHAPPYAILSHTWTEEEVLHCDIGNLTAQSKEGYPKLVGCCSKAAQDGFDWVWIDTCCIDKSSSAELSEAINSMYKWYQKATVCYAYLQDVTTETCNITEIFHITEFGRSRSFTRGWTLQELIAPQIVELCSKEWTVIGTKKSLASSIESVTGIPITVLRGSHPSTYNVAERMSWASARTTTREEDLAYCLLGIFDVNMPLLYGEGAKSFIRLQEQILRQDEDYSMFAWTLQQDNPIADSETSSTGFLAWSPSQFSKNAIYAQASKHTQDQKMVDHDHAFPHPSEPELDLEKQSIEYRVLHEKDYGRMFRGQRSIVAMQSVLSSPLEFTSRGLRINLHVLVPTDLDLARIAWLSYETEDSLVCVLIERDYESARRRVYCRVKSSSLIGVPKTLLPYFRPMELFIRTSGYFTGSNNFGMNPPSSMFSSKQLQILTQVSSTTTRSLDIVLSYPNDDRMKRQTSIHESPFKALWVACSHDSHSSLFRIDIMISTDDASCTIRELSQSSNGIDEPRKNALFRACAQYKKSFVAHTDRAVKRSARVPETVFSAVLRKMPTSHEDLVTYELRVDAWDVAGCPSWVQLSLLQEHKGVDEHPDMATEDSYRSLASKFPDMRYKVGRACAVAGYHALYQGLDLLPEVSIAEEARESETDGGKLIYDEIMSFKYRYAIMDDCKRTIELTTMNARHERHGTLTDDEAKLLYSPLPRDLPTVKKTLLTQMAAHDGNIERYAQLANYGGTLTQLDQDCVVRGVLHHTMYARWWADQITNDTIYARSSPSVWDIQRAIMARRIMLNDPSGFENGWPSGVPMPYIIWWPLQPQSDMLSLLAMKMPEMKRQCAAAAIVCDYENVYKSLDPEPSWHLWKVASEFAANPFYREDQERRGREKDVDVEDDPFVESYYNELMQTRESRVLEEGAQDLGRHWKGIADILTP
ncbi:beta transducin [Fusarium acutatum]|uniref:Beta transducin n=1 Tax=Fusarium acutatum TaxID=78861 RepID=A0A8H4NM10_9HYPO|nr:beta transducin [Fusarium acutatum]